MSNEHIGWLPYGSSHSSVLFFCPMTTEASILAIPATSVAQNGGAASDFDSVKGMKPQGSAGNGSLGYLITDMVGASDLNTGGQLSYEIEATYLTDLDTAQGSTGIDLSSRSTDPTMFSVRDTGTNYFQHNMVRGSKVNRFKKTTAVLAVNDYYDGFERGTTENTILHSDTHGEFITVNIAWYQNGTGIEFIMAYDGVIAFKSTMTGPVTGDLFNRFYTTCQLTTASTAITEGYMRNLQISSLSPAFGHNRNLGSILLWSDSLFLDDNPGSMGSFGDAITVSSLRNSLGSMTPKINVQVNSGHGLSVPTLKFSATVAAANAVNANTVVFMGGLNDVNESSGNGTLDVDAWDTAYKANLTALFDNGTNNIIVCTITSLRYLAVRDTDGYVADKDACNAKIKLLEAWAATNHPTKTLLIADMDAEFGGETSGTENWVGGFNGADDNLHWHSAGHVTAGNLMTKTIKDNLLL